MSKEKKAVLGPGGVPWSKPTDTKEYKKRLRRPKPSKPQTKPQSKFA